MLATDDYLFASLLRIKTAQRQLREAVEAALKVSGLSVRPLIRNFAIRMEDSAASDDREIRDWKNADPEDLMAYLWAEMQLLEETLTDGAPEAVWAQAADVAVIVALIADAFNHQFVGIAHCEADVLLGKNIEGIHGLTEILEDPSE